MLFPITGVKEKKIRQSGRGETPIKMGGLYILKNTVFSSVGIVLWLWTVAGGYGEWEDIAQRGKSLDFQKLNVKVEHGLDTDKKFFCLLYSL